MRREIFIDMDDTMVALSEHVIKIYNEETGENFDWRKNDKWMWTDADKVREKYFHNILHRKNIFYNAPILGGEETRDYINFLVEHYDVYAITTPMSGNNECFEEKIKWFKKNKIKIHQEKVIFIHNKGLCADWERILIDDKISNLDAWKWNNGKALAFTQGWNKEWAGPRIEQLHEIERYLK